MATEKLENEVVEIFKLIEEKKNFLLSGGAGSGKTYSLVSIINNIFEVDRNAKIACITYTNAAVHEIESRVGNRDIRISTIHDFLWANMSFFQEELKATLIEGINDTNKKFKSISVDLPYENEFPEGVKYTENLKIADGKISHDEVIVLANQMYKKYIKLCDIVNDKYDYILVDEYQDTAPEVVEILLDFLSRSKNKSIIGFFGDSMQSIYDDGVGNLNKYLNTMVFEVQKKQNRRNPQLVMDISNKLRTDGLIQVPSEDVNAPNMLNGKVKDGNVKFLYGSNITDGELKNSEYFEGWDFNNSSETKELRLTHNLIAEIAGFPSLMEIYDNDPIVKLKSDFNKYLKDNKIIIEDENKTFDEVLKSVNWVYKRNPNKDKHHLDVALLDKSFCEAYELVKNKPFVEVKKIYIDKDYLISDKKEIDEEKSTKSKRDKLIRHLFKIQHIINCYETGDYNEFIKKTSIKIKTIADKIEVKNKVTKLSNMKDRTLAEVIEFADRSNLCLKDDNLNDFIKNNEYLYTRISKVKYEEFIELYEYLEGYKPFSTQHKTKGKEYKNILIILNNGKWNNYNFEYLFNKNHPNFKESVCERTSKLFYVCCTRAMENLIVYCDNPSKEMLETAQEWFGIANCMKL